MFKVRTSAPTKWEALWNNTNNGGWSWCINGRPTHQYANVLANCVGYACSRFNEIYNEESGYKGMRFKELCCNAEDFWTKADSLGLKKGQKPKAGSIMVWQGIGSLPGHVAIVERVSSDTQVLTSESGYDSPFFWNANRSKGNGNWGCDSNYIFRGFVYNPGVKDLVWKQEWHLYDGDKMLTGWQKVDGKWYYLNDSGVMQTGWLYTDRWYLLGSSGAMQTGWQKISGKWYFLQPYAEGQYKEGEMRTGWLYDKGYNGWFLLSNNGDMLTGWQKVGDKWYFLEDSGKMHTGWLQKNNKWYYLDLKDGYMYTGTHTIDGKKYTFDSSGALVE